MDWRESLMCGVCVCVSQEYIYQFHLLVFVATPLGLLHEVIESSNC